MTAMNFITHLSSEQLRHKERTQRDAHVRIRFFAIVNVMYGMSREESVQAVGISCKALHHWIGGYKCESIE